MQESICADAASFELPSAHLTACISEAKQCVDLCIKRRAIEKSGDKQHDPDNYAILRGNIYTLYVDDCSFLICLLLMLCICLLEL